MLNDAFFAEIHNLTRIPLRLVSQGKEYIYASKQHSLRFFPDIIKELSQSRADAAYTISFEHIAFGMVFLPDGYIFLGPAPAFQITGDNITELLAYAGLAEETAEDLLASLSDVPAIELGQFFSLMRCIMHAAGLSASEIVFMDYPPPVKGTEFNVVHRMPEIDPEYIPQQADFGRSIFEAIKYGKVDELQKVLGSMGFIFSDRQLAPPTLEQMKKKIIRMITSAGQAACSGGLSFSTAELMCEHYLDLLDKQLTLRSCVHFFKSMLVDYASRVHRLHDAPRDDALTRRICRDIEDHLHEKISPSLIAEHLNMNVSYLCNHFKATTGQTIVAFINQRKVQEAKYYLEQRGASVTQTAVQLGYTSSSYFNTVFRKETGMTPANYLRIHRP